MGESVRLEPLWVRALRTRGQSPDHDPERTALLYRRRKRRNRKARLAAQSRALRAPVTAQGQAWLDRERALPKFALYCDALPVAALAECVSRAQLSERQAG